MRLPPTSDGHIRPTLAGKHTGTETLVDIVYPPAPVSRCQVVALTGRMSHPPPPPSACCHWTTPLQAAWILKRRASLAWRHLNADSAHPCARCDHRPHCDVAPRCDRLAHPSAARRRAESHHGPAPLTRWEREFCAAGLSLPQQANYHGQSSQRSPTRIASERLPPITRDRDSYLT